MSGLLAYAGPLLFGLAMWAWAWTGWLPRQWRFT